MKKYIVALIVTLSTLGTANAQPIEQYYTLGWNIGLPLASFSDYISTVSVNGGAVQGHFFVTDKLAAGVSFGWNTYYQELDRATYSPLPGVAITAVQLRYVNAMPLKASVNYFFSRKKTLEPYVGLGVGGVYMTEHAGIQDRDFWDTQWGFQVSPELGAFIRLGNNFALNVAAMYNLSTNSFTFGNLEVTNVQRLTFNVGLTYKIHS